MQVIHYGNLYSREWLRKDTTLEVKKLLWCSIFHLVVKKEVNVSVHSPKFQRCHAGCFFEHGNKMTGFFFYPVIPDGVKHKRCAYWCISKIDWHSFLHLFQNVIFFSETYYTPNIKNLLY